MDGITILDLNTSNNTSYDDKSQTTNGVNFAVPFLIVTCILGYIGNSLVLFVYSRKKYRRSNAGLYILNLAVGDTLACTVVLFHVTEFYQVTWPLLWRSDIQCAIHRTFRFLGFDVTVFTMVAIAIDRYFAVCYPIAFRTKFTARRTKFVIIFLWMLSLATASPALIVFKAIYGTDNEGIAYKGKLNWACKLVLPKITAVFHFKAIYINVLLFFIPTLITACIYVVIVLRVWRARKGIRRSTNGQKEHESTHWKTARILLVVFSAYVITHGCFAAYNTLFQFDLIGNVPPVVNNIGLLLPYANSFMNPIIYSLMHASFRKSCWEAIKGNWIFYKGGLGQSSAFEIRGSSEVLHMLDTPTSERRDLRIRQDYAENTMQYQIGWSIERLTPTGSPRFKHRNCNVSQSPGRLTPQGSPRIEHQNGNVWSPGRLTPSQRSPRTEHQNGHVWFPGRLINSQGSLRGGHRNGNVCNKSHVYRLDHIHVVHETIHFNPVFQGSDQSLDYRS